MIFLKKCSFSFLGFELSSVGRFYAFIDLFRFMTFIGLLVMIFRGCLNLSPMYPENRRGSKYTGYVLYEGNRVDLTSIEISMLANVEKTCGKEYINNLPEIWGKARPTLENAVWLMLSAITLPIFPATAVILYHKTNKVAYYLAIGHFLTEVVGLTMGLFGAWYIVDARLCFLRAFEPAYDVAVLVWLLKLGSGIFLKGGILYTLYLYILNYCKTRTTVYEPPSPADELKIYLAELKSAGLTPVVDIELPNPKKPVRVSFIDAQIRKALHDIRLQVAEMHKDDPLVNRLLEAGKFSNKPSRSTTSIIKIEAENTEYKLLKTQQPSHHHHEPGRKANAEDNGDVDADDVKIILPEPALRNARN